MPPPEDPPIVHLTHVGNLPMIFEVGHLKADALIRSTGLEINECAEVAIKERRRTVAVSTAPFGYVSDYVPFYFAPRSPMLFSIHKGNVATFLEGQEPLVYIWSRLSNVQRLGLPWAGSDGNCAQAVTRMTNERSELEAMVDWPLMRERYWADTDEDGDRKRRRMAELLVHQTFPVEAIHGIVVKSTAIADRVRECVPYDVQVHVRPSWYF